MQAGNQTIWCESTIQFPDSGLITLDFTIHFVRFSNSALRENANMELTISGGEEVGTSVVAGMTKRSENKREIYA